MTNAHALIDLPTPWHWLPRLADIDRNGTLLVMPGALVPHGRRCIAVSHARQSMAQRSANRLDLAVAPGDHRFALALVRAYCADDAVPAATDPSSQALLAMAARVAAHDIGVVTEGATGTGKEGIARLVLTLSPRRDAPFVAVNCAALPESMLETMLFGHERGAFTGATAAAPGPFRAANGGTLLLDQISELPLALQGKLLRVHQELEVLPVGAVRPEAIDVRIIAAANRDLAGDVAAGKFRADLFYRLAVFPLRTIPLANRRADIVAIAAHWLLRTATGAISWPTAAALARLEAHDWLGNVRELGNVLDRATVLGTGTRIDIGDLAFDTLLIPAQAAAEPALPLPGSVRHHEDRIIRRALAETVNRRSAAQRLRISERTLRYKLAAMAVRPPSMIAAVQ